MKYAVIGGDERAAFLAVRLREAGHSVRCWALEKSSLAGKLPRTGCLEGCVYGADWVLLPVPAEREGRLHAPLSVQRPGMAELLGALWPGQVLCGGGFAPETSLAAVRAGLTVFDLLRRRDFSVGNAAVTAEGAVAELMEHSRRCLWGSCVLVTGWGRIASQLAPRLRALGASVTVGARKAGDRAAAEALGFAATGFASLPALAPTFDFAVNTVPAPVLERDFLEALREGTLLLELASSPGFDREAAEALGLRAVAAPGLPGRHAPETAARIYADTIANIIREREENDGE